MVYDPNHGYPHGTPWLSRHGIAPWQPPQVKRTGFEFVNGLNDVAHDVAAALSEVKEVKLPMPGAEHGDPMGAMAMCYALWLRHG